jgi:cytochrome c oxidase subunit 2
MRYRNIFFAAAFFSLLLSLAAQTPPAALGNVHPNAQDDTRVIAVTAKRYEFNPAEIRVKKGEKVRLKVRALDRAHGLEFKLYPEGAREEGPPGLLFAEGQRNWKLEKDQEREIEFVAERPGTYNFKCSVFCGWRHPGMKGKLIVEE